MDDDEEEEERWIEDEDDHDLNSAAIHKACSDGDDDEQYQATIDLFSVDKQSPDDDFHLTFGDSSGSEDNDTVKKKKPITIHLRGINAKYPLLLQSTGLTLWKSSNMFANYLYAHPELVQGKCVIELGAGLGLCGILAHKLGANRVVLTDGDTDTLKNMRRNVATNVAGGPEQVDSEEKDNEKECKNEIICKQLLWGKNIETFRKNWAVHSNHGFDVVMGCDVAYAQESLEPLFQTVQSLLSNERGCAFLLSFVFRGSLTMDSVFATAERHGLLCSSPCWVDESLSLKDTEGVYVFHRVER